MIKQAFPKEPRLSTPGDRLHKHRQAFPWHPSRSTRGQTTNMTDKSSHGAHFKVNHETDYTPHIKPSPGTPHRVYKGTDYTETDKIFPWSPSRSTRRQTTNMQTRLPLIPLSKYQGTDYTKTDRTNLPLESFLKHQETDYKYADKSSPGTPLEASRDRLHQEHRSLLLAPLLAKYQETSYIDNKQVFSWSLFSEHQETDYTCTRNNDRQLIAFLWVSFRNTPGDRLMNTYKSSSGTSCSVPRDRL